jgi:hypothetical protein
MKLTNSLLLGLLAGSLSLSPLRADERRFTYPRQSFRHLNHFVRSRLGMHLRRRSQRGWRAREGVRLYAHLNHLGLVRL